VSRGDWVSVGVTLVAIYVAYRFGGGIAAIICGIVGGIILLMAMLYRKDRPHIATPPAKDSFNPIFKQEANPNTTVNVYPPSAPAPVIKPSFPKPSPNLRPLAPRSTWFRQPERNGAELFEDQEKHFASSIAGVVACFRNESSLERNVAGVRAVRGSISFLDEKEQEIGEGADACWVGGFCFEDFEVRKSNCLIVALLADDGTVLVPYPRVQRTEYGNVVTLDVTVLPRTPKSVEVHLLRGDDLLLVAQFDFKIEAGKILLTPHPVS